MKFTISVNDLFVICLMYTFLCYKFFYKYSLNFTTFFTDHWLLIIIAIACLIKFIVNVLKSKR